jgi:hypothetical protein
MAAAFSDTTGFQQFSALVGDEISGPSERAAVPFQPLGEPVDVTTARSHALAQSAKDMVDQGLSSDLDGPWGGRP